MNKLTLDFIRATRDTVDEFRRNEILTEINICRLPNSNNYYAKLHGPLNGTVAQKDDGIRHKVFSIVFGRNIGTAKMITNFEAQAFCEVVDGFKIRHQNFNVIIEDIVNG